MHGKQIRIYKSLVLFIKQTQQIINLATCNKNEPNIPFN